MKHTKINTEMERDAQRWESVATRRPISEDPFVYAVRTTGVYCLPGCSSRTPNRGNVRFFDHYAEAECSGFRACLRCKPNSGDAGSSAERLAIAGCRFIESCDSPPSLQQMADRVNVSASYYQRKFRSVVGVTPKEYAAMTRVNRFARLLKSSASIVQAIYGAGYNTSSRCYAESTSVLGMPPERYRNGGRDVEIEYGMSKCALGHVLVATTSVGICRIAIGNSRSTLIGELYDTFPKATSINPDSDFAAVIESVVLLVDGNPPRHLLPLDIRGTAFQREVWQALQRLPSGTTVTYRDLAKSIGRPQAVRAVASACGANQLAVVIPCHRVVRTNGEPGGYRWGIERKRKMLAREASQMVELRNEQGNVS